MESDKYIEEVFKKIEAKDLGAEKTKEESKVASIVGEVLVDIFLGLLTLVIIGLSELFSPEWDWAIYASSAFWIGYILTQSASWFARVWIYITRNRHHEQVDEEYLATEQLIQDFVNADYDTPFIEEEATKDAFNRKKRAWVNKQKLKLLRISNRYRVTNVLNAVKNVNNEAIDAFELKTDRKLSVSTKNSVNRRIRRILETITNDWCENNLDGVKVKYNKVSRIILTNGYVASKSIDGTPDYKKRTTSTFINATVPSFLFISIIMFIIIPLGTEIDKSGSAWFQFLTKFFMVFVSGALMWFNSHDMFNRTIKKATIERLSTINGYAKKCGVTLNKNKKG